MKTTFFKTLAIIIGMVMSFSLASCGDDNDGEPDDPKAVAYYDVKYVTDLDEDWFNFYDVTITYVNIAGKEVTETIEMNSNISSKIEADMVPNTISFKIHVARKASIPTVDTDKTYHFNGMAQLWVQAYLKDNTQGQFGGDITPVNTRGATISGEDMDKFFERFNNMDIFDHSVELKK